MTIQPPTPDELYRLYAGNPIVGLAEQALRAFYVTTRTEAAGVLPLWRYYHSLTAREVQAVLSRFDPPVHDREDPVTGAPLPPGVEGWRLDGPR